jgi:hypothetical protein
MTKQELHRFARLGAEARLSALQRELAAIYQVFPDLRDVPSTPAPNPYTAGVRRAVSGVRAAVADAVTRRRFKMSREARKRIAAAQRKRWAEWRTKQAAGEPSASKESRKMRSSAKQK